MKFLQPPGWVPAKGYANGVVARGAQVFVGGQIGWNAQQQFESDDLIAQIAQALAPRRKTVRQPPRLSRRQSIQSRQQIKPHRHRNLGSRRRRWRP